MMNEKLEVKAEIESLDRIYSWIEDFTSSLGMGAKKTYNLQLATSELVTNIIMHGYSGKPGDIEISLAQEDDQVKVVYLDSAPAFDPTTIPTPDLTLALEDRPIGGMGIHLVRETMDTFQYERTPDGKNKVTLIMSYDIEGKG
jgi:anti-sigma regulatory factor (Ser/Thr protein kinase)